MTDETMTMTEDKPMTLSERRKKLEDAAAKREKDNDDAFANQVEDSKKAGDKITEVLNKLRDDPPPIDEVNTHTQEYADAAQKNRQGMLKKANNRK